ncbi:uncharacterized protein LDX57_011311 [Aspergillus melleus]|uniref:uncharacterized protein n=1 Tax=Aspergillus melleus TaxID=138277 RepID=UPI001E8EB1B7|nr:uncharacterized protein LDX57_011311 [Aspergillus melleus]KAH8433677.1 hypothetical protein LDX57_011311 [Aspergillus melleus]
MAEDTPAAAPAAESSVERAPAEPKTGVTEATSEPSKEDKAEDANGSEEKPSGKHLPENLSVWDPSRVLEKSACVLFLDMGR